MKLIRSLLLICFSIIPALSQAFEQKDGVPLALVATPPIALPGMAVTLSGTTVTVGGYDVVTIQVIPPPKKSSNGTPPAAAVPVKLSAKCDGKGVFSVNFTQTGAAGTYRVTAQSPVGTGTGSAEFQVQPAGTIGSLATSRFEELVQALAENFEAIDGSINKLPASDEREQLVQLSSEIASRMKGLEQETSKIKPNLDMLLEAMDLPPEDLAGQPAVEMVNELTAWSFDAEQEIARLKSLLPAQKQAPSICDMIHTAGEGMRLASNGLAFYGTATSALKNLAADKGIPLLIQSDNPKRMAWDFGAKGLVAAAQGTASFRSGIVGAANDALILLTDYLLDRYCGVYSGPIKATMSADFKHLGQSYWKYSITIEGSFSLRFPKDTPAGGAVRMTGEVFGNARQYTFWEDIEKVVQVPAAGHVLARIPITPGPFPKLYKDSLGLGQITNLLLPSIFYIPLEAQMNDDNVVIKFMDPVKEVEGYLLRNQLIIIYMAMGLPVPVLKYFEFPISGAHFILSRGMRNPAEITITKKGKEQVMKKVYERVYEPPDKEFRIEWKVDLDAANPPKK